MGNEGSTTLEVSRTIGAPIDRVYKAWSDPAQIKVWFGPGDCEVVEADFSPNANASYSISMDVGGQIATVRGTFEEVNEPTKISFTWRWDGDDNNSLVTVALTEEREGTRVTLTHVGLPDQPSREKHTMGWTGSLAELQTYLT